MKIILQIIAFFVISTSATASHISQGDIYYRYIGDSTGVANQYFVYLRLYINPNGQLMPPTMPINVTSSCFPKYTMNLNMMGTAAPAPSLNNCLPQNAPTTSYEVYQYRGATILPGTCSNFRFSLIPATMDQSVNIGNFINGIFIAELNNILSNNKSVKYPTAALRNFCINTPFLWALPNAEVEGDSIVYELIAVRDELGADLPYQTNYSPTSPLPTLPGTPIVLDQTTSALTVSSTLIGKFYIVVRANEFRYYNATQNYLPVGNTMRQFLVEFVANCDSLSQLADLSQIVSGVAVDTTTGTTFLPVACQTDTVSLFFSNLINCSSISPDGSDFRLVKANSQPIPILGALANCNTQQTTNEIKLLLFAPLSQNGQYFLYLKTGYDGNTLSTDCGGLLPEYDSLQLNVSNCSGIGFVENTKHDGPSIPQTHRAGNAFSILLPEDLAGAYQLIFYNLQGSLVFAENYNGYGNWTVQQMGAISMPGLYVCRLQSLNGGGHWQQKILVLP